jgi:hypothetical protein
MKKYSRSCFPTENSRHTTWDKFVLYHGFKSWAEMRLSVIEITGDWQGCITYEHYCKWFDIYHSALHKALQEE